jgi:FkbM family methyltransferase
LSTSTICRPIPTFSVVEQIARKWRMARRLYREEGALPLFVEVSCQICKPIVWLFDSCRWMWFRARGHKSFTVMGNQIAVFPRDPGISKELALYKVHEPLATRLLMETLKPGMNAVDIGGNIGYYAMLEARLVGPSGKVIAIEPMPENSEQLCKNVKNNGYENIHIHKTAIGDRDGTALMYIAGKSNWHSLHPPVSAKGKMKVSVSTLDSLLAPYNLPSLDLVRMDLEGYEIVVIDGMKRTLKKYGPRLLVELHPLLVGTQAMEKYLRSLEAMGYGIEWMIEQERDMPLRWQFLKVERPTMRELMNDPRVWEDPRALTVLFSKRLPEIRTNFESESEERVIASAWRTL